jgi:signal peptidase I
MAKRRSRAVESRQRTENSRREASTKNDAASTGRWLWEWVKSISVAILIFLVLRTFVVESFRISSGSMETTLLAGDLLLVNKAVYGAEVPFTPIHLPGFEAPQRGDIVVLEPPFDGWEAPYVKRIAATPGDEIAMRRGELYVNGERQSEEYVQHVAADRDVYDPMFEWQRRHLAQGVDAETYRPSRDNWGPLRVPEGEYFVMGDNRDNSEDSRYWGFVPRGLIKGRPLIIYYSFEYGKLRPLPWLTDVRWRRIGNRVR